jgi:hypothetical protein
MLFRDREIIFLESGNIASDRFADIRDSVFLCFALAEATWQAGTLSYPETIFTTINNDLPQGRPSLFIGFAAKNNGLPLT